MPSSAASAAICSVSRWNAKSAVFDGEGEQLGHLVLVHHRTDTDSDLVLTVECSILDADADLLQFPLGGHQ